MTNLFLPIYRLFFALVRLLIPMAGLFSKKIKQRIHTERAQHFPKLDHVVLFHAASLGEYEQAIPIIHALKKRSPKLNIVVTFFSASGYNFAIKRPEEDVHSYWYLPLESPAQYKQMISQWQLLAVVIIKYELWYEWVFQLTKHKIPVYWFSVVLYTDHFLTKAWSSPYQRLIQKMSNITVQDRVSRDLLESIGIDSTIVNEPRYDRVFQQLGTCPPEISQIMDSYSLSKPIVVFGSIWMSDITVWQDWIKKNQDHYSFVIAPHDISVANIEAITTTLNIPYTLWTHIGDTAVHSHIVVDQIGQLRYLYSFAKWAYVGGGFAKAGIHNTLESLTYGTSVIVGPNHQKFPEISLFAENGILHVLHNEMEIDSTISFTESVNREAVRHFMQSKLGGGIAHAKLIDTTPRSV